MGGLYCILKRNIKMPTGSFGENRVLQLSLKNDGPPEKPFGSGEGLFNDSCQRQEINVWGLKAIKLSTN